MRWSFTAQCWRANSPFFGRNLTTEEMPLTRETTSQSESPSGFLFSSSECTVHSILHSSVVLSWTKWRPSGIQRLFNTLAASSLVLQINIIGLWFFLVNITLRIYLVAEGEENYLNSFNYINVWRRFKLWIFRKT